MRRLPLEDKVNLNMKNSEKYTRIIATYLSASHDACLKNDLGIANDDSPTRFVSERKIVNCYITLHSRQNSS
jgi:hypothetical protein